MSKAMFASSQYCDPFLSQRFARKQYADIEIVQTEKKGFGLRAASDIGRYASCIIQEPSYKLISHFLTYAK